MRKFLALLLTLALLCSCVFAIAEEDQNDGSGVSNTTEQKGTSVEEDDRKTDNTGSTSSDQPSAGGHIADEDANATAFPYPTATPTPVPTATPTPVAATATPDVPASTDETHPHTPDKNAPGADSEGRIAYQAPTCTEEGYETYICEVCGLRYNTTIAALGHDIDTEGPAKDIKFPTCTEEGYKVYECKRCGQDVKVTLEKLDHDWGTSRVVTPATCTEPSWATGKCVVCGLDLKEQVAPALGHVWSNDTENPDYEALKEAWEADPTHNTSPMNDEALTKKPTCKEDGLIEAYTFCLRCGVDSPNTPNSKRTVPAVNHIWEDLTKHDHRYFAYDETDTKIVAGTIYTEPLKDNETVAEATNVKEKADGLRDENIEYTYTLKTVDGKETTVTETHTAKIKYTYTPVTCREDGKIVIECTICGAKREEVIPALGHDYQVYGWSYINFFGDLTVAQAKEFVVKETGKTSKAELEDQNPAVFVEKDADEPTCIKHIEIQICSICGDEINVEKAATTEHPVNLDKVLVTKYATCEEEGEMLYECAVCRWPIVKAIPAEGHDWAFDKMITPATCTEDGVYQEKCTKCGKTREQVEPATGHVINKRDVKYTGTSTALTEVDSESKLTTEKTYYVVNKEKHIFKTLCNAKYPETVSVSETCINCGQVVYTGTYAVEHEKPETVEAHKDPTCTEAGYDKYYCNRCHKPVTVTIAALGHDWVSYKKDAACMTTATPYDYQKCSRCGEERKVALTRKDHTPSDTFIIRKVPSCTEDGERLVKCAVCGETYTEKLPAKGHVWEIVNGDKSQEINNISYVLKCSVCGEVREIKTAEPDYDIVKTGEKEVSVNLKDNSMALKKAYAVITWLYTLDNDDTVSFRAVYPVDLKEGGYNYGTVKLYGFRAPDKSTRDSISVMITDDADAGEKIETKGGLSAIKIYSEDYVK